MISNIDLFAAVKTSKPKAANMGASKPSSDYTAGRPNSFKDSLREAGNRIDRDDNRSVRKELVGRSEAKLKQVENKSSKVDEKINSKVEPKEKQTEKIAVKIEEVLAVLQQLTNLQQSSEVTPENQTELLEGIKGAFQELTALQSKLDKLTGTKDLQLKAVLPELQQDIAEFRSLLEGILDELKTDGTETNVVDSNFLKKLETVIDETMPKLEVIAKAPVENSSISVEENMTADAETASTIGETKADNSNNEVKGQEKKAEKAPESGNVEAAEATNKTEKKEMKTEATGSEATEEEISVLEEKTEKASMQSKEGSKQDSDSAAGKEASKEVHSAAALKQSKTNDEGMPAIQQEQPVPVENTETVAAQTAAPKAQNVNRAEIINQIVKKAEIVLSDTHSEMRMQLEPENLGKLTLKIAVERGLITAKFTAESNEVKKVIESSLNELRDMLQEKGLEVQNFSVSVGQENKENNNENAFQQWKETVKLNTNVRSRGSYEGYMGSEAETPRVTNPYKIHNGEFDHIA